MKKKYNLVTIQFKVAMSEASKKRVRKELIEPIRILRDLEIISIEYFESIEVEE